MRIAREVFSLAICFGNCRFHPIASSPPTILPLVKVIVESKRWGGGMHLTPEGEIHKTKVVVSELAKQRNLHSTLFCGK